MGSEEPALPALRVYQGLFLREEVL
jgi:hypothetical protein